MIITKVEIKKFRGFNDVKFQLGSAVTVIAGQNGTQKTTLIGMLSQPFSITNKSHAFYGEKPLSGGNYRSSFADKFKLSDTFDIPKNHEWTLTLNSTSDFTVESIARSKSKPGVRFWKKGSRAKGSGYVQVPVIYLSLSRLFPIGEDPKIKSSSTITLTPDEFSFYKNWHNKILIIPTDEMTSVEYLASRQKNTLGVNTKHYDWKMNSAGQDNIGKILLAILSFKRLQSKHGRAYQGGILVIDELDATLYPASQLKLLEALRKFSSQLKLQIIFTTHSLNILEKACGLQDDPRILNQIKVVYLEKVDKNVKVIDDIPFDSIRNKLNVAMSLQVAPKKISVFTEDKEGQIFLKAIIKRKSSLYKFIDITMGSDNFIELVRKKTPGFKYLESLIVLDGDAGSEAGKMKRIKAEKNILLLPGKRSPERLLAEFLNDLLESSPIWKTIHRDYTKQFVFANFSIDQIQNDRTKAKEWFNEQKKFWGVLCSKVITPWINANPSIVKKFEEEFDTITEKYKKFILN